MEDILDVIVSRRSVRKFKPDMVEKSLIEKVVKAGTYAPTGMNRQSPIILAVTNKKLRDELSAECAKHRVMTYGTDPFYGAPVVLVVLADKKVHTATYDGSCVMQNMLLEAHSLGLGACWIHHCWQVFESEYGKNLLKSLGIEGDYEGVGHCILGYPDEMPTKPLERKSNYVYYIDWNGV